MDREQILLELREFLHKKLFSGDQLYVYEVIEEIDRLEEEYE